jgi:hypothetical protein
MLYLLRKPAGSRVVRRVVRGRPRAIAFPEARKKEREIRRAKLEDLRRQALRPGVGTPDSERTCPFNCSDAARLTVAADVNAVTASMARNRGSRIGKALHGLDELISVLWMGRVEVKGRRVTEITFSDEACEHDQLVPRPALSPWCSKRARRRHVITNTKTRECTPSAGRK